MMIMANTMMYAREKDVPSSWYEYAATTSTGGYRGEQGLTDVFLFEIGPWVEDRLVVDD